MSRDLTPIYADAQAFKDAHQNGGQGGETLEGLRRAIALQLAPKRLSPIEAHAALYNALRGMAWIAAMAERYDLDVDTLLDAPEDITRNVVTNTRGMSFDAASIQLGVGAAYFTGLLVGLKAGSE